MKKNLKRRDFIKKAGLAGAAATALEGTVPPPPPPPPPSFPLAAA